MARLDHAKLVEAARQAFEEHGYAGTTLERIASAAGLSRVTLHRHGVTKDGLLAGLVARATEAYREAMWPVLTGGGSGAERLEAALRTLCEVAEREMPMLLALRSQNDRVFHREDEAETLTRGVFTDPLERAIRDGVADGSLRPLDPLETATLLFNLVGWTYLHMRTGHGWPPERATAAVLDPILHGLLAVPGPVGAA